MPTAFYTRTAGLYGVLLGTVTSFGLSEEAGGDPAYLASAAGGCGTGELLVPGPKGMRVSLRSGARGGDSSRLLLWRGLENRRLLT